jgi:hypothetical protein
MGWGISEKGFQIVLSPSLPELIVDHLGHDVDAFLADDCLARKDNGCWILHMGGPKILEARGTALGLSKKEMGASWECRREVGSRVIPYLLKICRIMRVLILCSGNSARNQMAEGLLRHDGGPEYELFSAGTDPSHVRPEAIQVMREAGIDISAHRSKSVDEFAGQVFDCVLAVCDNAPEELSRLPRDQQADSLEPR